MLAGNPLIESRTPAYDTFRSFLTVAYQPRERSTVPFPQATAWLPTREEGLRRLLDFVPRAGRAYAEGRNIDCGPLDRSNVSTLSPYIRYRLVSEEEVAAAVLARYRLSTVAKFIDELCWRTYWKGWLELRPSIWTRYRNDLAMLAAQLKNDQSLNTPYQAATRGETGIECFDAWTRELIELGYLHNHARMWYASIWIFTLKLPWQLGADFFLRHLLDGDAASNTLSWRWVAGLQTRSKTYLARPDNITRYTQGRFGVIDKLSPIAEAIEEPPLPAPRPLPVAAALPQGRFGLLLTPEDLEPERLPIDPAQVIAVAGLSAESRRSPLPVSPRVTEFVTSALEDALSRARGQLEVPCERLCGDDWTAPVRDWAGRNGIQQIVTAYAPVGPARENLDDLAREGLAIHTLRRPWDEHFWPFARSGFFSFRERIPHVLRTLGLPV